MDDGVFYVDIVGGFLTFTVHPAGERCINILSILETLMFVHQNCQVPLTISDLWLFPFSSHQIEQDPIRMLFRDIKFIRKMITHQNAKKNDLISSLDHPTQDFFFNSVKPIFDTTFWKNKEWKMCLNYNQSSDLKFFKMFSKIT